MDFIKLIQSFQDLVFEVVAWTLFVPKTLLRSLLRPDLMVKYVDSELQKEPDKQFDDYMPPVLFYLILGAIPVALYRWAGGLAQLTEENLFTSILTTLISLVIYLAWIEWLNKRPLKRTNLKRLFSIQCYLVTPAQMLYTLLLTFGWYTINPYVLGLMGTLILIAYESFAFRDELKVSWLKGLWYAAVPQIALFFIFLLIALLSSYFHFNWPGII